MNKAPAEGNTVRSRKIPILIIAAAILVLGAVLALTKGILFSTEFGGGTAVDVQFTKDVVPSDLDAVAKAVKNAGSAKVISVQQYGERHVLVRTTPVEDPAKLKSDVASALGVNQALVTADNTPRSVNKDALISLGISLLIAGGIALVYFFLRFGLLPALGTLLGYAVMAGFWILPYTLFSVFDYKAFTVLAVGVALFTLESAVVYQKKIRKASDVNPASSRKGIVFVTAALGITALLFALLGHLGSIAVPLLFVSVGAAFTSLLASPSFVLLFKD